MGLTSSKATELKDAWMPMTGRERKWARKNLIYGTNRHLCICETLRLAYDLIYYLPDEKLKEKITKRLVDAFMMGKKMSDRLHYYREKYGDITGKSGKNLIYILDSKKRRDMRWARKL